MKIVKDILLSILIAFVFSVIQNYFQTTFLIDFLKSNLITILIALLAINSTTQSLILTKIRELVDTLPITERSKSFSQTRKQMIFSISEHIILILLSMILFILVDSPIIQKSELGLFTLQTSVISCFIYSLFNLFDNVKGVFVILDFNLE